MLVRLRIIVVAFNAVMLQVGRSKFRELFLENFGIYDCECRQCGVSCRLRTQLCAVMVWNEKILTAATLTTMDDTAPCS
ncbi:hypothetical protein MRX96_026420 [Rhipicephalus microplus]